jgi:hypothetical protein
MKVKRNDIKWFLDNILRKADGKQLSNEELANELANYMEVNPDCVDINGKNRSGRYYYSTVGYGVFSLLGERYRMGRIEIFDKQNDSGYQVDEGTFCMPFESANQFECFMRTLETDLPINIEIGNHKWCQEAVAEELGIPVDKLNDIETKKEYYRKKNDIYAQEQGFKDWDDYLASTELGKKLLKSRKKDDTSTI